MDYFILLHHSTLGYRIVQVSGLLCTVDLFPVPDCFAPSHADGSQEGEATRSNVGQTVSPPPTPLVQMDEAHHTSSAQSLHHSYSNMSTEWQDQSINYPNDIFPSLGIKVLHRLGNYAITENIKQTQSLAGATFVQGVKLEYQGKMAIVFAFSVGPFIFQSNLCLTVYQGFGREDRRGFHYEV